MFQVPVTVKPGPAAVLVPAEPPGMPTVSNTRSATSRCLLRFLKLQLQVRVARAVTAGAQLGLVHS